MNNKKKGRRGMIALAIISLAAIGVAAYLVLTGTAKAKAPAYTEAKVTLASDSKVIEASGNIESVRQSNLSFASIGLISAVYVSEGQKVRDGQALAALDDSEQRYNFLNAQQKLEQNKLTGNIRQTALAELELAMRKTELERAKLTAPFAGFISSLNVEPGEYVANGKVAMTLVDRSTLVATLQIDEVDIPQVKVGQRVAFTFDALTGRSLDGIVSKIPPVGTITNQGLAVFDVEAKIDNPPDDLLPGFSFSAQIVVREPKSYLSIPAEALVELPKENPPPVEAQATGTEPKPASNAPEASPPGTASAPALGATERPARTDQNGQPRKRDGSAVGTRQLPANLSPEQVQALIARRQAAAAGQAAPAGLGGLKLMASAGDSEKQDRPLPLACLIPGADGKPETRKFLGIKRSDGTVAVLAGLAEGDIVLLPAVEKKTTTTVKKTSSTFGIPGLGGPPPGERR